MRRGSFAIAILASSVIGCGLLSGLGDYAVVDAPTNENAANSTGVDASIAFAPQAPWGYSDPTCNVHETAQGIFVSSAIGDDNANGEAKTPVRTIGKALALGTPIYVDEGVYPESLTITSDVVIEGGWVHGDTWTKDCGGEVVGKTTLASPDGVAIRASAPLTLRRFTVHTKVAGADGTDGPGESCIGIFATGNLELTGVDIQAGSGGRGGVGKGAAPVSHSCNGTTCGDGTAGGGGPAGADSDGGAFTNEGWSPANGEPGGAGGVGHDGTKGGAGQSATCAGSVNIGQQCVRTGGFTPMCVPQNGSTATATSGTCGCGGGGGGGGGAGFGGGASVGIYVAAPLTMKLVSTRVTANGGGAGAAGENGTSGTGGTNGAGGQNVACAQCGEVAQPIGATQCTIASTAALKGGAAGGKGGAGGAGAKGGNGGGGPSFSVVRASAATFDYDPQTAFVHLGGGSGAAPAADAPSGNELVIP